MALLGSSSLFSVLGEFKGLDCDAMAVVTRGRPMVTMLKEGCQNCTVYFVHNSIALCNGEAAEAWYLMTEDRRFGPMIQSIFSNTNV